MTIDDAIVAALFQRVEQMAGDLALLRAHVLREPRRKAPNGAYSALLRAIALTLAEVAPGTNPIFTSSELIVFAAERPPLNAALVAAIGPLQRGSARKLGRLFLDASERAFDGYAVVRVGVERDGVLWSLRVD